MISTRVSSPRSATPTVARAGKLSGDSHRFQAASISGLRSRSVRKIVADSRAGFVRTSGAQVLVELGEDLFGLPLQSDRQIVRDRSADKDQVVVRDNTMHDRRLNMAFSH